MNSISRSREGLLASQPGGPPHRIFVAGRSVPARARQGTAREVRWAGRRQGRNNRRATGVVAWGLGDSDTAKPRASSAHAGPPEQNCSGQGGEEWLTQGEDGSHVGCYCAAAQSRRCTIGGVSPAFSPAKISDGGDRSSPLVRRNVLTSPSPHQTVSQFMSTRTLSWLPFVIKMVVWGPNLGATVVSSITLGD